MPAKFLTRTARVVEDEILIRMMLVAELEDCGWAVIQADAAEAAIAFLSSHPVDVLITDIRLPGKLSGWDVADASRITKPSFPVIYASSHPDDPARRVDRSLFFDKPYNARDVATAAKGLLNEGPEVG
jgi:DNA-binding response OmpR family regulator